MADIIDIKRKKNRAPIPQSVRFNVFRRDNFTCRYCGRSSPEVVLHCDHSTSVKDGGDDTEGNLVTSCVDCNLGKSSKSVTRPGSKTASVVTTATPEPTAGLVGMWGHTFVDDGQLAGCKEIQWQFKVIRMVTPDAYVCQLFSWLDGGPTNCEMISTKTLLEDCKLYATNEQMIIAYEKECRRRKIRIRKAVDSGQLKSEYDEVAAHQ